MSQTAIKSARQRRPSEEEFPEQIPLQGIQMTSQGVSKKISKKQNGKNSQDQQIQSSENNNNIENISTSAESNDQINQEQQPQPQTQRTYMGLRRRHNGRVVMEVPQQKSGKVNQKQQKLHHQKRIQKNKLATQQRKQQAIQKKYNFEAVSTSDRTSKILNEIVQIKGVVKECWLAFNEKIIQKKLWRKEISEEIFSFVGEHFQKSLVQSLLRKEEQRRCSLFLLNRKSHNTNFQMYWNYVLINPSKQAKFQIDMKKGKVAKLEDYGHVLEKGIGEKPPKAVTEKIKKEFLMFEYEPGFDLKKVGMEEYDNQKYESAIKYFTQFLQQHNYSNKMSLLHRGISYMKLQKLEEALKDFKLCSQLYSYQHISFLNSGWILLNQGKYREALVDLKTAATLNPFDSNIQIYIAQCYMHLKQFKYSQRACKASLQISPNNVFAHAMIHSIELQKKNSQVSQFLQKLSKEEQVDDDDDSDMEEEFQQEQNNNNNNNNQQNQQQQGIQNSLSITEIQVE